MRIERVIDAIVIHCAATPNGKPVHVGRIDEMHAQRGFHRADRWRTTFNPALRAIGYHRFVGTDGASATGRHLNEIGAHVQGSNAHSIGLCLAGTDRFTPAQWTSLKWDVIDLTRSLAVGRIDAPIQTPDEAMAALIQLGVRVCGHRDYSPDLDGDGIIEPWEWLKTCPGFDVASWLRAGMVALPGHLL